MPQGLIDTSTTFVPGDHVLILSIDVMGTIKKTRYDSSKKAIYTVFTDDPAAICDGVYYAHEFELKAVGDRCLHPLHKI